ncbi:unnamed protein product [Ixodes hexagonus]
MASYLRHSFTLPNRKKAKYRADLFDTGPDHSTLSKSEVTLFTGEHSEGAQYYAVDRLEDVYSSTTKFPDFYGGYPLEEVESLPRSRLNSTSDYGSEQESSATSCISPSANAASALNSERVAALDSTRVSALDRATASIYATLRMTRKKPVSSVSSDNSTKQTTPPEASVKVGQRLSSAEEFHCCCRNSCHTGGGNGGYRMNMHCCKVMEPLWESETAVPLRAKNKNGNGMEWYDRRKRHQSCPSFQAHMVAAFEQSLSNMTSRLQHLTATAEQKDSELTELRSTIEALKQQSAEAGLTKMALQSMAAVHRSMGSSNGGGGGHTPSGCSNLVRRHTFNTPKDAAGEHAMPLLTLGEGMANAPIILGGTTERSYRDASELVEQKRQSAAEVVLIFEFHATSNTRPVQPLSSPCFFLSVNDDDRRYDRRASNNFTSLRNTPVTPSGFETALQDHRMSRQLSTDSMSSVNSASSACSNASAKNEENGKKHKKKKGWLRSSFSKAFSRSKKNRHGSVSDVEDIRAFQSDSSAPNSPLLSLNPAHMHSNGLHSNLNDHNMLKLSHSSFALHEREEEGGPEVVQELRKQLREKDLILTDIRLEALSSAHQLDNLKETLGKMRNEMLNLKQDNDRLQRLVSSKSLNASETSLLRRNSMDMLENRLSAAELSPTLDLHDGTTAEVPEGKRVTIAVHLGCHGDLEKFLSKSETPSEVLIGSIHVSGKTKWDHLDSAVRRAFKDHVLKVDPISNLGLNSESILCYHIDDVVRSKEAELPELLPCGYLVGETLKIQIVLRGTAQNAVDALALQTLIPKSIVQRYVSLLSEHRRIILCGPSGTGKTFLAQKLAEYLVLRSGRDLAAGSIATFSVDHKSAKELRQYLSNVAEQCENSNVSDLPAVIILDNLHHVGSLGEVFNGFLSAKYQKCPFIIGTMNQATCSTTNLQLHHNFRWVLCANHMEPVKGFLGRFLRRRLAEEEIGSGSHQPELAKVVDWMPRAWHHLNRFLETHSSSDVTIGPRLFLACPMDVSSSQVWFTDLWNYSIVPYLLEAVREGLQLYGKRAPWEDPAEWVLQTYPWPGTASEAPQLLRLRPEDLGYDPSASPKVASDQPDADADPLLNMLMRLQEAASYSSPQGNDSESADLDHSNGSDRATARNDGFEPSL